MLFTYEDRILSGEELLIDIEATPSPMKAADISKLNDYKSKLSGSFSVFWKEYLEAEKEHNSFDSLAGTNTKLYETQMNATVVITGEQVTPVPKS